jgi:DNA-directed RNA polymerase specialized sigma24 family protein
MNPDRVQQLPPPFSARFSRYRRLLYFVACRVLGCSESNALSQRLAKNAVQRCLSIASCNPPKLLNEGAFRSWLFRILLDEALAIRRTKGGHRQALECTARI